MISLKRLKELGVLLSFLGVLSGVVFASIPSYAGDPPGVPTDLTRLTLEQLMDIQVTSVSKGEENFSKAASAIFVLTQEDIRRSGSNSIPELFRMVPGMMVQQLDSSSWAVTSRGFNGQFASNLLVLIDGRSVFSPINSGTFWDEQDMILEDIERIEVIRGPGGTLWGANAVNGVINIITKNAHETTGGQVSAGGGNLDRFIGSIRYGEKIGDDAAVRVWGKYYNRNALVNQQGSQANDEFEAGRGGMRVDWDVSESNSITFQGNAFLGEYGFKSLNRITSLSPIVTTTEASNEHVRGGSFLTRWKHRFSDTSDMALQFFFSQDHRDSIFIELLVDTYDMEFQHHFKLSDRHDILWGLGHRFFQDSFENNVSFGFSPDRQLNYISNVFIQDRIALIHNELYLTIGSKFSINNYTGFEFQPSARLAWAPNDQHTLWTAVSRAVRTPSRFDDSGKAAAGAFPPTVIVNHGNLNFESEDLLAVELGYRFLPHENIFFDLAVFANFYDDLKSFESGVPFFNPSPAPGFQEFPINTDNKLSGNTMGVELAATLDVTDWWRLKGAFTWFQMDLKPDAGSTDTRAALLEGRDPEFQWNLISHLDLPSNFEFDQMLYYVDALKSQQLQSYFRMDLRLGWRPEKNIEVSLVGQNLLDNRHQEREPDRIQARDINLIERAYFAKLILKF